MRLILDACVAIAAVVAEDHTFAARALREGFRNRIHELIAPDSLPIEVAHALTRAERMKKLKEGRAQDGFSEVLDPCPILYPYFDYLDRAMELSSQFRIGVFDCIYVALAEEQECPVVTLDKRFLELFPNQTISLYDV